MPRTTSNVSRLRPDSVGGCSETGWGQNEQEASMQSETFRSLVKPTETIQRRIWLGFLATVPMYICLAYVRLGRPTSSVTPPQSSPLAIPVVTMSLLAAILAPYVPRLMLSESRLRKLFNREPNPEAPRPPPSNRQSERGAAGQDQNHLARRAAHARSGSEFPDRLYRPPGF
jgi:hypothetical protein